MLKILYGKRVVTIVSMFLLLTLAACGGTSGGTTQSTSTSTPSVQTTAPVVDAPTQIVATPTTPKSITATPVPQNNPSSGPTIILTPTPAPGGGPGSQQVTFPDRILIIGNASQQSGVGNSTPVSLVLTIKNTGAQPILNQATFFQLVGSQGDIFGYQSNVTPGFYGTIPLHSSHNGTIVFLVPTGAMSGGLRLLYRSEIDAETVFVRLQIS